MPIPLEKKWTMYPPPANSVLHLTGYPPLGATIRDRSGSSNHGTIDGATWTRLSGELWYLNFDKIDDVVTITSTASITDIFDGGGTAFAWVYAKSDGESDAARIIKKGASNVSGWHFGVSAEAAGKVKVRFNCNFDGLTNGWWSTTATVISINSWSLVTVTYDSDSVANDPIIYVNGVSVALTEDTTPVGTRVSDTTVDALIGNREAGDCTFDGGIALPGMNTEILSATQVVNFRQQTRHLFNV